MSMPAANAYVSSSKTKPLALVVIVLEPIFWSFRISWQYTVTQLNSVFGVVREAGVGDIHNTKRISVKSVLFQTSWLSLYDLLDACVQGLDMLLYK